ncbi:MAG: hypothetical protein PHC83_04595 [Bacteroidales bacterium]|nr:hypothetical protein [Bacteroidales bacterium]MDD4209141.1 hypothetical protein [Bacteroidales bacterium]
MKKSIFSVAIIALLFTFTNCTPVEEDPITLTFSGDIIIDLGDSDADVLAFVTASDGSAVTVSGIDYEKAGEQTGTFKAGDVTETKAVKVKADAMAGRYYISVFSSDGQECTQGDGWGIVIAAGDAYNQIKIPSTIETGDQTIFPDITDLVVTFNGKDDPSIDTYEGGLMFMTTPPSATWEFSEITYGLNTNGKYAINGFRMDGYKAGFQDFYYTVSFERR